MCLIALDFQPGPNKGFRPTLLLVANRDEYYKRPSQQASYWKPNNKKQPSASVLSNGSDAASPLDDSKHGDDDDDNGIQADLDEIDIIYGGRDLLEGGTWMACSSNGRFATITNFHCDQDRDVEYPRSRGEIVSTFVANSSWTAREFILDFLQDKLEEYAGFSVLLFDGTALMCCTNRGDFGEKGCDPPSSWYRDLPPGLYGLSNHLLDSPWPRTVQAKKVLAAASTSLTRPYDGKLEENVVEKLIEGFAVPCKLEDERADAPVLEGLESMLQRAVCIHHKERGTRTTAVVCYDEKTGFEFIERNFKTPFQAESLSRELGPLQAHKDEQQSFRTRNAKRSNDRQQLLIISEAINL